MHGTTNAVHFLLTWKSKGGREAKTIQMFKKFGEVIKIWQQFLDAVILSQKPEITIQNGIGNISRFCTGRPQVISHAVNNTSDDRRLPSHVTLVNSCLLKEKYLDQCENR